MRWLKVGCFGCNEEYLESMTLFSTSVFVRVADDRVGGELIGYLGDEVNYLIVDLNFCLVE